MLVNICRVYGYKLDISDVHDSVLPSVNLVLSGQKFSGLISVLYR